MGVVAYMVGLQVSTPAQWARKGFVRRLITCLRGGVVRLASGAKTWCLLGVQFVASDSLYSVLHGILRGWDLHVSLLRRLRSVLGYGGILALLSSAPRSQNG